jgi:hypothetical protein
MLKDIQAYWKRKSDAFGDVGSCVLGAGFEFTYKNKKYFMPPTSKWQGSISWEHCKDEIRQKLEDIGCKNIYYHWGRMD